MKIKIVGLLICILLLLLGSGAFAFQPQTVANKDDTTPPSVWFSLPKKGIFYPFFKPIVLGSTQIWAHASDDESGLDYCELYIDNELKATFSNNFPRSWTWSEHYGVIISKHIIKGVAYDVAGNIGSDEIIVWKFF